MIDPELRARIIAYNRQKQADHIKGLKVDEIKSLLQALTERPGLAELLGFLRKIREVLADD